LNGPAAVLLIAHGSRRKEANDDLARLAGILRAKQLYAIVETAYLELADPDIPTAGQRCVAAGAMLVKLLPYFLSAGAHVVEDLERHRRDLVNRFPQVTFELCPPLGLHPLMIDIVLDRLGGPASSPQSVQSNSQIRIPNSEIVR